MAQQAIDTLDQMVSDGLDRGLIHHLTEDERLDGRIISVRSKNLVNFGSCSYMGLEQHPKLKEGCIQAVQRYGTQFSSSRAYTAVGLYEELESSLREIFGKPVLVSASTTLGHLATLPIVVGDNDVVILDLQVHSTIQMSSQLLKARQIPIHLIPHNDMARLEEKIQSLKANHDKIWYLADGVYSMYGDYVPLDDMIRLLNTYEQFHVYVDDAHGMSWAGKHGCGYVRSQIEHHPKMILAVSLNKAFASAGGAIIFPNQKMAQRVKNCGGTLIFCGPIQPPMLGVACASAKLHLSDEFPAYQKELAEKVEHMNDCLREKGLPQYRENNGPLFFIPMGLPRYLYNMIKRVFDDGYYINSASFPATPMRQGGLRFMVNRNLEKKDIEGLVDVIAKHYSVALLEEGSSCQSVAEVFNIPEFEVKGGKKVSLPVSKKENFKVELKKSIADLDEEEWDSIFLERGNLAASNLKMLEEIFGAEQEKKEDQWDFFYVIIRDPKGEIVLATLYTCSLMKEDMLSEGAISKQIEKVREKDPYYLTSKFVMLGAPITKGDHLFINRKNPNWKKALDLLLQQMQETVNQNNASQMMLREFFKGDDEELKKEMLQLGFIEYNLLDICLIKDLSWKNHDEYLKSLGQKYRYNVRKEILAYEDKFKIVTEKNMSQAEIEYGYELYGRVFDGAYELNVFKLPYKFFETICHHPDYDIMRLYIKEDIKSIIEQKPVAIMYSYLKAGNYFALIVGLNYDFLYSHKIYKQILYQTVQRAWELNCKFVDLAFTAVLEKKKIGAKAYPICAFTQAMDHYNYAVIDSMTKGKE